MARIISTFEHSTTDIQYGYAEYIADGPGYHRRPRGPHVRNRDLYEVVQRYAQQRPASALAAYLVALKRVNGSDSLPACSGS